MTNLDPNAWNLEDPLSVGRRVLVEEASTLMAASESLDDQFVKVVDCVLECRGRVVVSGVGKSGHIGRKIAATLASTGTPAFFVHAAEAGHGDLGMITDVDVLIALSNSGESEEVVSLASFVRRFNTKVISITGNLQSSLARLSHHCVPTRIEAEACPLGVAPTSSTTLQLAIGDAIAMACLAKRGFSKQDFARTHPFGQLGRRFYVRVKDVMQDISSIPCAQRERTLKDIIPLMAVGRMGAVVLLRDQSLAGIFTDSDLRRLIATPEIVFDQILNQTISNFATPNPMKIDSSQLASEALEIFQEKKVSRLVCVDGDNVVGLLGLHDLLKHKIT